MAHETPTLRQLEYFVCLAESAIFRGAADIINISQPSVRDIDQLNLSRMHVLAWRQNSPNRGFYRQLAKEIRTLAKTNLCDAKLSFVLDTDDG
jgi:hypothetical protein